MARLLHTICSRLVVAGVDLGACSRQASIIRAPPSNLIALHRTASANHLLKPTPHP